MASPPTRRDPRRYIYVALDLIFAAIYAVVLVVAIPNRLPLAAIHLWSLPVLTLVLGAGPAIGGRLGWRIAVAAGALMLLDVVWLLVRILVSSAVLAGVYGAFGKAASSFALLGAALVIEAVALLPAFQLKFLMTRAGRRAVGAPLASRPA